MGKRQDAKDWVVGRSWSSFDVCDTEVQDIADFLNEWGADSKRLEDLELALKEGDVCGVTASYWDNPAEYTYIEIEFDSGRESVTRESLADAIDEAMEEPEQ